ncbi:ATP-dependent endonuclease, partial [Bacteroidota bacterium]
TKLVLDFVRINKTVFVKTPDEKNRYINSKNVYVSKLEESLAYKLLEKLSNEFILIPASRNIVRNPHPTSEKAHVEEYIKDSLIELANSKEEDKKVLFSQFTDFIDKISPLIEKIDPVYKGKTVVDLDFKTGKGEKISLSTIGGGNNELLLLLHEIIVSGGIIMAIEEPEIHLHPQAERKLYRFMEEFSVATQMFVVTHSPVFVQPGNIRGLYRVVKRKEGTFTYSMDEKDYINRDRLEQELNSENCEMFFADKVLLVEGISDKIFMEGLIEKRCKSTDEIKIVSAYSKDNFEIYVDLLRIFDIPYIVLTDLDALKGRFQIKIIWRELKHQRIKDRYQRIIFLKTKGIHVLSKGALESCYPKQYRKGVSKPLDALYAIHNLTDEEYNSERMNDLKEVIEALEK